MKKTKIYTAYLPQYHATEDNNRFWGEGFTDWVGVRNAKPLFDKHNQPKIPLNNNYYNLSDFKTIQWQADLARKHGVNGFNIYHYWFKDGKQELEKPAELLLSHSEIDIEYFFTWDNSAWKRTWSSVAGNDWAPLFDSNGKNGVSVLVDFEYGGPDQWRKHFEYLIPFFQDQRYLKIDNKPVFAFMTSYDSKVLSEMGVFWNQLSLEYGFDGMYLVSQKSFYRDKVDFNNTFIYEPVTSAWGRKKAWDGRLKKYLHISLKSKKVAKYIYDYDKVWQSIIKRTKSGKGIPGCFVKYDDTPRRGKNAELIINETPEKFQKYFCEFYRICCENNKNILLLTAWNEWGEGAYLEPDEKDGFAYLEALKIAIETVDREME